MSNLEKIVDLNDKLHSVLFGMTSLALIFVTLIVVMLVFIGVACQVNDTEPTPAKTIVIFFSIIAVLITLGILNLVNQAKLEKEIAKLTADYVQDVKTETVITSDIIDSVKVNSKYCPLMSEETKEQCTYVKFVSNGNVNQIFLPLKSEIFTNVENPLTVTYYELSEKERSVFAEIFELDEEVDDEEGMNLDFKVEKELWSIGVSVEK